MTVAQATRAKPSNFSAIVAAALLVVSGRAVLEFAALRIHSSHEKLSNHRKESPAMAKRKRAKDQQPFSRSASKSAAAVAESTETAEAGVADQFVGKWNRLISTTNWEKGQIICAWREALMTSGASVTEYSDDAWAQLVGGVTSQHVGRLRRVFQRFGDVIDQYEGLHWSHFQSCLDWDDAEMWLEGSIQNGWSVSQMRGKRWETVGATPEEQQAEVAEVAAELNTEAQAEDAQAEQESAPLAPTNASVDSLAEQSDPSNDPKDKDSAANGSTANGSTANGPARSSERSPKDSAASAEPVERRTRLSVDVESLPDDLAEAFESFKLAIIAHRRENWRDTTPESVVECLESLRQLALADSSPA